MIVLLAITNAMTPTFATPAGAASPIVIAQSGSVGGTIGRRDKNIPGDVQQPAPKSRAKGTVSTEPNSLPATIHFTERGMLATYTCILRRLSGNVYEAKWNVPVVSKMTVTVKGSAITIRRQDTSNAVWSLVTAVYSGTRTGNNASGSFNTNGYGGTWTASW